MNHEECELIFCNAYLSQTKVNARITDDCNMVPELICTTLTVSVT